MDSAERRGRGITVAIACWVAIAGPIQLALSFAGGLSVSALGWFACAIPPLVLASSVVRRLAWARYGLVGLFSLGSGILVIQILLVERPWVAQWALAAMAALHAVAGTILWASSAVDAYFTSGSTETTRRDSHPE